MAFRRSDKDLAYGDDYDSRGGIGGGGRWDRDRFERTRARSRGPPGGGSSNSFHFEEKDSYGPRGGRRDIEVDDRYDSRGGRGSRVEERDRYEDDRYTFQRKSRPNFLDDDRYRTGGRELAPYKNRYDEPEPPRRPGFARRQSSWDAHDRRPIPRYDDRGGRDDDRGGVHDDLKVSVRVGGSPQSRGGYDESRYDDRRYEDDSRYRRPEPDPRDFEDYRDSRIIREREVQIERKAPRGGRDDDRGGRDDDRDRDRYDDFDRDRGPRRPPGMKKGKTRMPKRLVHRRAILDLGYPFEEEDDFYLVRYALGKDHIDECIKISESYFIDEKTTYRYNETRALEAPPPPAPASMHSMHSHHSQHTASIPPDAFHNTHSPPPPAPEAEIIETVTTKIIENPTPSEVSRYKHSQSHAGEHHSSHHGDSHDGHSDHTIHGGSGHGHDDHNSRHNSVHESFHESIHESSHSDHGGHSSDRHDSRSIAPGISIVKSPSPDRHRNRSRARSKSRKRGDLRLEARSKSRAKSRKRSKSRRRSTRLIEFEDESDGHIQESASLTGPLGLIVPDRTRERERKKERDIKAEIKALEAEKKALRYEREAEEKRKKYERKADRIRREGDTSSSDEGEEKKVIRVEKDRRGRLNVVRSRD